MNVFSFAGKTDEKSSTKSGAARKKKASKTKQSRGSDVIQQIPPPVSSQRPSHIPSQDEAVSIEKDTTIVGELDLRAQDERLVNAEVT